MYMDFRRPLGEPVMTASLFGSLKSSSKPAFPPTPGNSIFFFYDFMYLFEREKTSWGEGEGQREREKQSPR